jgi:hypothetical protein
MALQSLGGIAALLAVAWLLIENRRAVALREVAAGLALTAVLALLLLKLPQSRAVFAVLTRGVDAVAAATRAGTSFVFGYLGGAPRRDRGTRTEIRRRRDACDVPARRAGRRDRLARGDQHEDHVKSATRPSDMSSTYEAAGERRANYRRT